MGERRLCATCLSLDFKGDLHKAMKRRLFPASLLHRCIGVNISERYPCFFLVSGKTFDITYVRVLFESPRPESWGVFRRKTENSPWEPYQFYSATCRDTYGLPDTKETVRGDDTRVLCTSEYSDISPLRRGTVAFSTLEGRPSAFQFDTNPALQVNSSHPSSFAN